METLASTHDVPRTTDPSTRATWAGRILSGLAVAFLTFDTVIKLIELAPAVESTTALGFDARAVPLIGLIELSCLVLYLIPRTARAGLVLWTGYLGGGLAIHLRLEHPLFSHVLFPVYVGALLWLGLWLRDAKLRAAFPLPGR